MINSEVAKIETLFDLQRKHFSLVVPEYQRDYAWETEQLDRLLSDLLRGAKDLTTGDPCTFLGPIVLCKRGRVEIEPNPEFVSCDIVDGQQRITTTMIIMLVMLKNISLSENEMLNSNLLPTRIFAWAERILGLQKRQIENSLLACMEITILLRDI